MKVEELRIGNLIQKITYKSPWRILCFYGESDVNVDAGLVNFPTDDQHHESLINFEPIPLSHEWLIRLGFEKKDKDTIDYSIGLPIGNGIDLNIEFEDGQEYHEVIMFNHTRDYMYLRQIRFIHQLQNIYFALTGEELTIKVRL